MVHKPSGLILTLTPPSSIHIPPVLLSHTLSPPNLRTNLKPASIPAPPAFTATERQLRKLGLELPVLLAADRSAWWGIAVQSVEWDLEENEVRVEFVDGSEERWDLRPTGGGRASERWVEESSEEEERGEKMDWSRIREQEKGKGKGKESKEASLNWERPAVFDRLLAVCTELREVYEDLGMGAGGGPSISTDEEYGDLVALAADRSRPIPPVTLRNDPGGAWSMRDDGDEDEDEDGSEKVDDCGSVESQKSTSSRPTISQLRPKKSQQPQAQQLVEIRGQLKSTTRRPPPIPSEAPSHSSTFPTSSPFYPLSSTRHPHDLISAVSVLSTTRSTLLDLFSTSVLPILKDRLPPTFSIWVTTSALDWCRRTAIRLGATVAEDLVALFDPERMERDTTDEEDELSEGEEEDWGRGRGRGGGKRARSASFSASESSLGGTSEEDDELLEWCKSARDRADRIRNDSNGRVGGGRLWIDEIESWEVTKPYVGPTKKKIPKKYTSPSPSSPLKSYSTTPGASDSEDWELDTSEFFFPDDLLGEGLLPPRLPRAVLEDAKIHDELNEIAGLQIRMEQLRKFSVTQLEIWERGRAQDRHDPEALRQLRRKKSPEATRPLQVVTADKAVAQNLSLRVALEISSESENSGITSSKKKQRKRLIRTTGTNSIATQSTNFGGLSTTRKRKSSNLVVIKELSSFAGAHEKGIRAPFGGVVSGSRSSKKRKLDVPGEEVETTISTILPPPNQRVKVRRTKTRAKTIKTKMRTDDAPLTLLTLPITPPKVSAVPQIPHPHSPTKPSPLFTPHLPSDPSITAVVATAFTPVPFASSSNSSVEPPISPPPCSRLSLQELSIYRQGSPSPPKRPIIMAHWQDWQGSETDSDFVDFGFAGLDGELQVGDQGEGDEGEEQEQDCEIGGSSSGSDSGGSEDEQEDEGVKEEEDSDDESVWEEVKLSRISLPSVQEEEDIQINDFDEDFNDVLRWSRDQRNDFPLPYTSPPSPSASTPPQSPSAYPVSSERSLPQCVVPALTIRPLTPVLGVANIKSVSPPPSFDRAVPMIVSPTPIRPLSTSPSRLAALVGQEKKRGQFDDRFPIPRSVSPSRIGRTSVVKGSSPVEVGGEVVEEELSSLEKMCEGQVDDEMDCDGVDGQVQAFFELSDLLSFTFPSIILTPTSSKLTRRSILFFVPLAGRPLSRASDVASCLLCLVFALH